MPALALLPPRRLLAPVVVAALAACGGAASEGGEETPTPACTEPMAVTCADEVTLSLNLQPTSATAGLVANTAVGAGWTTTVNAEAGGFAASPPGAYVYGKFTASGLVQVALTDEDALTSMGWDIAFRRQVIRVNSLNSGPSCVQVAAAGNDFAAVASIPVAATWQGDDTFDGGCFMIPDPSGIPGMPATALGGYFNLDGCVRMTHAVYVVALADGRYVKLTIDRYYESVVAQDQCDTGGTVPGGSASAHFAVRWAYLP